jgi:hypothetical protein
MPSPGNLRAIALTCMLSRGAGSPIACETIDLGPTGMRLTTGRPLALDETVSFAVTSGDACIRGEARVVCQERPDVYALRFARLSQPVAAAVAELAARA